MAIQEKVLVIEDEEIFQDLFTNQIGGVVELLQAYSQQEAREYFSEHGDISLIVLDGIVPNYTDEPATKKESVGLVHYFRYRGFRGKMLAYSSNESINTELMENGCTGIIHHKREGPAAVLRELGIT